MTKLTPGPGMPAGTSLVLAVETTPAIVLTDQTKRAALFEEIEREVDGFVYDLSTARGRNEVKALVTKIVKTKTTADEAGKAMNESARAEIAKVDEARREIRSKLDELRDKARAPLTEWEEAEKARAARVEETMERLKAAAIVQLGETAAQVQARLEEVKALEITDEEFGDLTQAATVLKQTAIGTLGAAVTRITEDEANAAELARLKQEAEERRQREEEARLEAERAAEEARRINARADGLILHINGVGQGMIGDQAQPWALLFYELETKVPQIMAEGLGDREEDIEARRSSTLATLRAEFEREKAQRDAEAAEAARQAQEQARAEAAEEARQETARKAEEARQAEAQRHADELAAAQRRADEAEAARKADQEARDKAAAEQAAREADARAIEEARQRDTAHRAEVIAKAETALTDSLLGEGKERARATVEKTAKAAIAAIVAGLVPGVAITF